MKLIRIVLDLPQLYTRPSAATLLATLLDLQSQPSSWGSTPRSGNSRSISGTSTPYTQRRKVKSEGVPAYLTKIVSSALQWIEDDAQKEQIWETAAHELSARSGRTGQGDLTRSFAVPSSAALMHDDHSNEDEVIELTIFEPALTADNLGHKTWASSFALAKRLCQIKDELSAQSVMELGAGTGLVGMAAACVLRTHVLLTDLPEIVPNLERNLNDNAMVINSNGGSVSAAVLDWRQPEALLLASEQCAARAFSLILAADMIYSSEHPELLSNTIRHHLSKSSEARLVLEAPIRDAYSTDLTTLRTKLSHLGLVVSQEGWEIAFDDWSCGVDGSPTEVKCWWSVWRWP